MWLNPKAVLSEQNGKEIEFFIQEVDDIVKKISGQYEPDIAECRITTLFRDHVKNKGGREVIATINKIGGRNKFFATHYFGKDFDCFLDINIEYWRKFTETQKIALIHHELLHIKGERDENNELQRDKEGNIVWKIIIHDIEEFEKIKSIYGEWQTEELAEKSM